MRKLTCIALVAAGVLSAGTALAQNYSGGSIAAMSVGTAAGVTSTIAAIVYTAQGRAFSNAWVVVSLITSAICIGTVIGLAPDAGNGLVLMGVFINSGLAAYPLFWTARTAWSDVEPGALFEPETPKKPATRVAEDLLDERHRAFASRPAFRISLVSVRF